MLTRGPEVDWWRPRGVTWLLARAAEGALAQGRLTHVAHSGQATYSRSPLGLMVEQSPGG